MRITRKEYNELKNRLDVLEKALNGGSGSGNFGHSGRPGQRGGSGKGTGAIDTDSVAMGTMLRDHIDMSKEYKDEEHRKLCDIADSLYNADIGPEHFKPEYKELYDKYGKEYFDKVLDKMASIDRATDTTEQASKLLADYKKTISSEGTKPRKESWASKESASAVGKSVKKLAEDDFVYSYDKKMEKAFRQLQSEIDSITSHRLEGGDKDALQRSYGVMSWLVSDQLLPYIEKSLSRTASSGYKKTLEKHRKELKEIERIASEAEKGGNKKKNSYGLLMEKLNNLEKALNGGAGSGNFGHAGRPGERGGSGKGTGVPHNLSEAKEMEAKAQKAFDDYAATHSGADYDQKEMDRLSTELDQAKEWRQSMQQDETYKKMGESATDGDDIDLGGEPKDIVNFPDGRGLDEATGALGYNKGKITIGYNVDADAPFKADADSEKQYKKLTEEYQTLIDEHHKLWKQKDAIAESGEYVIDPNKPAEYGNLIRSYSNYDEVMRSNMPQDKKDQYAKLTKQEKANSARSREIDAERDSISENAKYYPNGFGAKSALLISGLAKGVNNYLGQRSDGAGEGSFNDRTKWAVNQKAKAHQTFIEALHRPDLYTTQEFNSIRDASAKLASSQASYLKRVENSINDPNFMGSREFANTARAIKNMTREQAIVDNTKKTKTGTYVSFKGGLPKINY